MTAITSAGSSSALISSSEQVSMSGVLVFVAADAAKASNARFGRS
jgi:hypothetical protein